MTATVVAIFAIVYFGMILGGLPFLQLDRTGVALLGAIALVGAGALTTEEAARARSTCPRCCCFSRSWWCRRRCGSAASTPGSRCAWRRSRCRRPRCSAP